MKITAEALKGIERLAREGRIVEQGAPPAPAPIAQRISEKEFMQVVIDFAIRAGWRVLHVYDMRRSVGTGWPDLFAVRGRRVVAAELKLEGEHPTADQSTWLECLAGAGIETYLWRPADFGMIQTTLA